MVIKIKEFLIMLGIQTLSYGLLVINYRAVAQAHYMWSALSDFAIATLGYFVLKHLATSASTVHQWLGYALGGVVGSIFGIWLSTVMLGS
jgi:ABC-type nitrate/sulfonate/bicarbonate transport system permease component